MILINYNISHGAGAQGCKNGNEIFYFLFPRSGKEAKRGVEFRHSPHNAYRIRRMVKNESILTLGPANSEYSMKLKKRKKTKL